MAIILQDHGIQQWKKLGVTNTVNKVPQPNGMAHFKMVKFVMWELNQFLKEHLFYQILKCDLK